MQSKQKEKEKEKEVQIADSVHKYIPVPSKLYLNLIDTREFQRLRRLGQLGGVQISYPSATHSRFAHSLGAFHIADKIITTLQKKHQNIIEDEDIKYVRIASLIHDVGHGPFSHMFEDIFSMLCDSKDCFDKYEDFRKHENITEQIVLSSESEVGKVLEETDIDKRKIADLIIGKAIEDKPFLNQIIASQLDGDSIDYLMRDSMETGVSYGLYNVDRLLAMLKIAKNKNIVVKEKGLQSTEQIVVARYMQFTRVYFHKTVRCWEFMMKAYISALLQKIEENNELRIISFIKDFAENPYWKTMLPLTDDLFYTQLHLSSVKEKNGIIRNLATRIQNRELFKSIPLNEKMANKIENNSEQIDSIVESFGYPTLYWGVDRFFSRYYIPYDELKKDAILIELKNETIKQLSEVSEVVSSLAKPRYNSLLICPEEVKNKIIEKKVLEKM